MSIPKSIVILGAGPSGMSVGWGLIDEDNVKITYLEASTDVGGLSKTMTINGIRFDIGPHRLSPDLPDIVKMVKDLLGDDLVRKENIHGLYFKGLLFDYPPKIKNFLNLKAVFLGLIFGFSFALTKVEYAIRSLFNKTNEDSFKNILLINFGRSVCNAVFFPLVKKVYGTFDLHPEFAKIRFSKPSLFKILKGMLKKDARVNKDIFYYPKKGYGQIFKVLEEKLKEKGQNFELGVHIKKIEAESLQGPFKIIYNKNDLEKTIEADIIVSSIPNKYLIDYLLQTNLIDPLLAFKHNIKSKILRLGILLVRDFDIHARVIIFPESKFIFNRICLMNHFSDFGVPKNHSVLMVDVICDEGDYYVEMGEDEFNDCLLESILQLGWFKKEYIDRYFSLKIPYAYPHVTKERYSLQNIIDDCFNDSKIILCGREASTDYNNAHNAMAKGFEVARYINGEIKYDDYKKSSKIIGRLPISD